MDNQEKFNAAFETITGELQVNGPGFKGIAAALSMDSNTHIIVTAPNWETLRVAWDKISGIPLDEKKAIWVMEAIIGKIDYSDIEPKPPLHKLNAKEFNKRVAENNEKIWMLHSESDSALIGYRWSLEKDGLLSELGPVVKGTIIECKLLLRQEGWPREEIEKLNISDTDPDDDIPF